MGLLNIHILSSSPLQQTIFSNIPPDIKVNHHGQARCRTRRTNPLNMKTFATIAAVATWLVKSSSAQAAGCAAVVIAAVQDETDLRCVFKHLHDSLIWTSSE